MSDDPVYQNAIKRLAEAEAAVKKWRDFIETYNEIADDTRGVRVTGISAIPAPVGSRSVRIRELLDIATQNSPRVLETEKLALEILREAKFPVPTIGILNELQKRGVDIPGKDPRATLHTRLSRSQKVFFKDGGWHISAEVAAPSEQTEAAPSGEGGAA
ncbi:hypothetical protein [Acidocella sp.]|uniref:hypothetical protein n=1 Tax=Acidocella sp. TaxID=50710 RepID=UPI002621B968|nr:hypothetical protein [Acidocella sp.]